MKPNLLKVIILILILVIITMSFYSLKIKEDLLELERINSISDPDIKIEKKQFDIFKVLTVQKEVGHITIENGELYEGMVFFTAGSSWSKKPIIIIGDSSTSGIGVLQGRLDTFNPNEDGSCMIKRRYTSVGEKAIFGEYIIDINGITHTIPFQFSSFTVE